MMDDMPKELLNSIKQSKPKAKRKRKCAPEKDVRKQVKIQVVEAFPGCWHFAPVQTRLGKHGIPDDLFCIPVVITQEMVGQTAGLFVAIEAKAEDGKATGVQLSQIQEILNAGGVAGIVRGVAAVSKMVANLKKRWL